MEIQIALNEWMNVYLTNKFAFLRIFVLSYLSVGKQYNPKLVYWGYVAYISTSKPGFVFFAHPKIFVG